MKEVKKLFGLVLQRCSIGFDMIWPGLVEVGDKILL